MKNIFFLILLSVLLSNCGSFDRSSNSGYQYTSQNSVNSSRQFYMDRKSHLISKTKDELGIHSTRPMSENESQRIRLRIKLNRLEANLETQREKKQYYKLKPYLRNDVLRIRFLQIPTVESRGRWATANGLTESVSKYSPGELAAIERSDIVKGMTKKGVKESWGEPDSVEVSGDPIYGNERWLYLKYISSSEGYSKENRVIYFDSGRVIGWMKE